MVKTERLTPTQRLVLRLIGESEFTVRIDTGFKSTSHVITEHGETVIRCQYLVPYFLVQRGLIERTVISNGYELTAKGQAVYEKLRKKK